MSASTPSSPQPRIWDGDPFLDLVCSCEGMCLTANPSGIGCSLGHLAHLLCPYALPRTGGWIWDLTL